MLRQEVTMTRFVSTLLVGVASFALAGGAMVSQAFAQCGDGVISGAEQCDDGNTFLWDGCNLDCLYEQVQRAVELELSSTAAPATCTPTTNTLGLSFSASGRQGLNTMFADAIADGSLDVLMPFLLLDDPLGFNDANIEIAALSGMSDPQGSGGALDSWHLGDESQLDSDDLPRNLLPGSIVSGDVNAGPGVIELPLLQGTLRLLEGHIIGRVDSPTSLPSPPPAQLAPGFVAFESLDASSSARGLCGNITVGSLSLLPTPADLATGGQIQCSSSCPDSRSYTYCGDGMPVGPDCNSLLDVLVSGCSMFVGICIPLVYPTQPDVGVGANPPNTLVADPTSGKVTVVEADDAYSSFFHFVSQRVHQTNNLFAIFADGFETSDPSRWSVTVP
jgi:cysteine-rich repeat protein